MTSPENPRASTPKKTTSGFHHVTAIASDPQANVDFYAGLLGLRLVKKTVNFDDPSSYHLYYGDEQGSPGSILTFFPWPGARRGVRGSGQITRTGWRIAESSMGYWIDRLRSAGSVDAEPQERFGEQVLGFEDPDGLALELVTDPAADEHPSWDGSSVPERHGLRGFAGVTLLSPRSDATSALLTQGLGFEALALENGRQRFASPADRAGQWIDVISRPGTPGGRIAAGSVHHLALRAADDAEQVDWQRHLTALGQQVTEVKDRQYFRSIYFREPGGVLFEIATDGPGFATDETPQELGLRLQLPPWLEPRRAQIQALLPELRAADAKALADPAGDRR